LLSRVERLRVLPPGAFWPPPKIDSALVRLTRDDQLGPDANAFSQFVHQLFSARRKMLRKALANTAADPQRVLDATGFDPQARPETFLPAQLLALYRAAQ